MEHNQELFDLQVDPMSRVHLLETTKWAKFLAIVGFVLCALIVITGIFFGSIMGSMLGNVSETNPGLTGGLSVVMAVVYILFALLYFFPCLFLYRFATKMKAALNGNSQEDLTISFQNLKSMFKFVGILMIILLAFYGLVLLFAMIGFALGR
ncbi:MAG TPA: DUF5362 family protein [Flavisolibacter sp.]|nr:DUF5362 family protein [Flavisolibacter sp.]